MKNAFTRLIVIAIVAVITGCAGTGGSGGFASGAKGNWEKTPITHTFRGRVVSLEVEDKVYFYHGQKLSVYEPETDSWDHRSEVNPYRVDETFAVTYNEQGMVFILAGVNGHIYRYDIEKRRHTKLRPLPATIAKGARIVSDEDKLVYVATGMHETLKKQNRWYRYNSFNNQWEFLGKMKTVNPLGSFSAGLTHYKDTLYAWGDHHVSYFDPNTKQWGKKIFHPMRYRPALGKGGMYTFDKSEGYIFVTLGRGSNSIGVMPIEDKTFYYLRPRLPFFLSDDDDTLFVSTVKGEKMLNVLSTEQSAIYSIRLASFTKLDTLKGGKTADNGSPWDVHSVNRKGAGGELFRHKDSYTNMLFAPPYVYNHRKNILRRFHLKSKRHSWVGGCCGPHGSEFKFHKKFITSGAGSVYDNERYIYLFSGHDRKFFRVDLWGGKLPETKKELKNPQAEAEDMLVERLAKLPQKPASNTAIAYHKGTIWAVFDPKKRTLYRYDIPGDQWIEVAYLPVDAQYDKRHGFVLSSSGDELFLFAKDSVFTYDSSTGWATRANFGFEFYADGGMVVFAPKSDKFFVAVGNSTTALGAVDARTGAGKLLDIKFPDVVSVAGQRMFIHKNQLYIARGHNSAEIWTIPIRKLK